MISLYDPEFLKQYQLDFFNLGQQDIYVLAGGLLVFVLYIVLSYKILPNLYISRLQHRASRQVQKAIIKRQYIEEFEKVI